MGGNKSILSTEQLDEYVQLTYLTKSEIIYILKKFSNLGVQEMSRDFHYRFHVQFVMEIFPEIKYNPFRDRLFTVFSSYKDEHFSFEDILDLLSVMSENCPLKVKAAWAFKVFDFNDDNQITKDDLFIVIDRLTKITKLQDEEKDHICDILLNEMDLQHSGGMSQIEFLHAMTKMPEFCHSFYFKP